MIDAIVYEGAVPQIDDRLRLHWCGGRSTPVEVEESATVLDYIRETGAPLPKGKVGVLKPSFGSKLTQQELLQAKDDAEEILSLMQPPQGDELYFFVREKKEGTVPEKFLDYWGDGYFAQMNPVAQKLLLDKIPKEFSLDDKRRCGHLTLKNVTDLRYDENSGIKRPYWIVLDAIINRANEWASAWFYLRAGKDRPSVGADPLRYRDEGNVVAGTFYPTTEERLGYSKHSLETAKENIEKVLRALQ